MCLGLGWTAFIWALLLPALPRPSLPGIQPQALPPPSGSEAAAAGLCAGQCILKVSGNNVMNDGAPEVLEHFQAFRNRREEALVSTRGKPCSLGRGLRASLSSLGKKPEGRHGVLGQVGCLPGGTGLGMDPVPPLPP